MWAPAVAGDVPTWKACGENADAKAAASPEGRETAGLEGRSVVPSPPALSRDHAT